MTRQLSEALRHHTASSWREEALWTFPQTSTLSELSAGKLYLSGWYVAGWWSCLSHVTPLLLHLTVGWLTLLCSHIVLDNTYFALLFRLTSITYFEDISKETYQCHLLKE